MTIRVTIHAVIWPTGADLELKESACMERKLERNCSLLHFPVIQAFYFFPSPDSVINRSKRERTAEHGNTRLGANTPVSYSM